MKKITITVLLLSFLLSPQLYAQQQQNTYSNSGRNFKRGVAAVMFSTIGGAVLGLSTLSFYDKPQEHTNNITVGALIGLVAGVGYVVYDSSRRNPPPSGNYDFSWERPDEQFKKASLFAKNKQAPVLQYQFDF
jgi:hypothetical protein